MFIDMGLERFNIERFEEQPIFYDFFDELDRDPNEQDENGHTILHAQVWKGCFELKTMQHLINKGANLELRNNNGKTALLMAVIYHKMEMIQLLIASGADVKVRDSKGNSALHYVALQELNDCFKDGAEVLEILLKEDVDVNAMNDRRETPLMWAARGWFVDIVEILLEYGANVHLRNENMDTCLHLASAYIPDDEPSLNRWDENDCDVLLELAWSKACVNCFDAEGRTALDRIRSSEHPSRRNFLLQLVKVAALVNWRRGVSFDLQTPLNPEDELDREMASYFIECCDEVHWLESFRLLPGGFDLCQFARRGVSEEEKDKAFEIYASALDSLLHFNFPIYHDFLLDSFPDSFLRWKASDFIISTRKESRLIVLNPYAIFEISTYLEKSDLFNLLIALKGATRRRLPDLTVKD